MHRFKANARNSTRGPAISMSSVNVSMPQAETVGNRHRTKHVWYPTKRFYVIPIKRADALAKALKAAARDEPMAKQPGWYAARDEQDQERYDWMVELEAPEAIIARQKRRVGCLKKHWI